MNWIIYAKLFERKLPDTAVALVWVWGGRLQIFHGFGIWPRLGPSPKQEIVIIVIDTSQNLIGWPQTTL